MTAALQLHLAKRTHSITKRMLRIISFILYDDKAADAGCAVAAECRSVVEAANKGKEITQLTTQIEVFVF